MAMLRASLFTIFFMLGTVVTVLLGFPAAAIGRAPLSALIHGWARWHRLCAALFLGIRTRIEGGIPRGAVMIAAKHQSMFETVEMLVILDRPVVVMKKELTDIPGWGWVARRYGVIPVDRAGGSAALRTMLAAAKAAVAQGRPVMIFPEGTRVAPGDMPPLQPGFAGLYKMLGIPVVPIALDSGRLWPRHGFAKRPGVVTMLVGDPIGVGLPRAQVESAVHKAINALEA